jgi:DNA-binding NarL/FixJ family response regulator
VESATLQKSLAPHSDAAIFVFGKPNSLESEPVLRLLLVENHATFAEIVTRQFLSNHEVRVAASLARAQSELLRGVFDAVLVDYDLDDGKGDVLVRDLVATGFAGRIIGISSHDDGNRALAAAGAHASCPKARFHEILSVLEARR